MSQNKIVIAYWADSELGFIDMVRNNCIASGARFSLVKLAHAPSWFTARRSIAENILHLGRLFGRVVAQAVGGKLCLFGTNTCRVLFFASWLFKEVYYVYNELPSFSKGTPACWIDKLIFRFAKHVFVSTEARARYVRAAYGLTRQIGVLENITFCTYPEVETGNRNGKLIFSGSVTEKRFNENDIRKLEALVARLGQPIDVFGVVAGEISERFSSLLSLKGVVSHQEMLAVLTSYDAGLLSYYTGEPNYDFCAPLKLYEYIACGCKVVSINRNAGLVDISARYPALIQFADAGGNEVDGSTAPSAEDYRAQRASMLQSAIDSNRRFAEELSFR